jgi:putative transposase
MRKSRFTEEQIAYAMRQVELGVPVAELCRKAVRGLTPAASAASATVQFNWLNPERAGLDRQA